MLSAISTALASPGPLRLARAHAPACLLDDVPGLTPDADGLVLVDLDIDSGSIGQIRPHGPSAPDSIDLAGRMVWPSPIDVHVHLDKGHIWPRARNPDGTFNGALDTVARDRSANWTAADVRRRMGFGLRCAFAHGTAAMRTHLDSTPPQGLISFPVMAELREAWAGRIALQAVSLATLDCYRGPDGHDLARLVAEHGGILGGVPFMEPDLDEDLDNLFNLAIRHGLDLDFHVDETGDPEARTLRHIAEAALRHRFEGKILCGHCCSLAQQPADEAKRTLDLVAAAGIAIVSLPMCNMYLQDRVAGRTPRWRGVTLGHELRARGIQFVTASDNTRDPFYAYGDHDLVEVFRESVRILQLDHPLADWPTIVTREPAAIMGLADRGRLAPGLPADLVIFEGRRWSEVLSRPESRRVVLRAGRPIDTTPPAYAELDELFAGGEP